MVSHTKSMVTELYAYLESELHHLLDDAVVVVHVAARAQLLLPMGEPTPANW